MAKNAGMPWDAVLSAELARHYKPHPQAYLTAADLLGLDPEEILFVSAHVGDSRASAETGMKQAYVIRPLEYGPGRQAPLPPQDEFDYIATDFLDLASQLGA